MSGREWFEQTAKYFTVGDSEHLTCTTLFQGKDWHGRNELDAAIDAARGGE